MILHPTRPTTYGTTPNDIYNNKFDICAALADWGMPFGMPVSMKNEGFSIGLWYTSHNNQPCYEEGEETKIQQMPQI